MSSRSRHSENLTFTNHATRALTTAETGIEEIGEIEETEREVDEVRGVVAVRETEEKGEIEKEESATGEIVKERGEIEVTEVIDTANVLGRLVDIAHPEVPGATLTTMAVQIDTASGSLIDFHAIWRLTAILSVKEPAETGTVSGPPDTMMQGGIPLPPGNVVRPPR